MVYAVMGAMAFQNASRRDNAVNFVTNRLSTENMSGPVVAAPVDRLSSHDAPAPSLICEFRFATQAARDTFYTDLQAALAGANGPVVGSWIAKHNCPHDQAQPAPCVESERVTF